MGRKNFVGVRRRDKRNPRSPLLIDFLYVNHLGQQVRFRKIATVQNWDAAVVEARRLKEQAAATGRIEVEEPPALPAAPPGEVETFAQFIEGDFEKLYMPNYRPSTQRRYKDLLRQSVLAFFGRMKLDQITPRQIKEFAAVLKKKKVHAKGPVNFVRTVLRAAHEENKLLELFKFPRVFKESKKLPACCSDDEYAVMLEAPGWLGHATALAGDAGLRQGEVRALEVQDIDFAANKILVRRAYSDNDVLTPKNGDERSVDMTPYLADRMRAAVKAKLPRARVIVDENGQTPVRQEVLRQFKRFQRQRGFRKQWSFHSLRHRFCTTLARHGVHVEAIMQLAGHKSLATTLRYIHATSQDRADAIRKLGEQTSRALSARAVSK